MSRGYSRSLSICCSLAVGLLGLLGIASFVVGGALIVHSAQSAILLGVEFILAFPSLCLLGFSLARVSLGLPLVDSLGTWSGALGLLCMLGWEWCVVFLTPTKTNTAAAAAYVTSYDFSAVGLVLLLPGWLCFVGSMRALLTPHGNWSPTALAALAIQWQNVRVNIMKRCNGRLEDVDAVIRQSLLEVGPIEESGVDVTHPSLLSAPLVQSFLDKGHLPSKLITSSAEKEFFLLPTDNDTHSRWSKWHWKEEKIYFACSLFFLGVFIAVHSALSTASNRWVGLVVALTIAAIDISLLFAASLNLLSSIFVSSMVSLLPRLAFSLLGEGGWLGGLAIAYAAVAVPVGGATLSHLSSQLNSGSKMQQQQPLVSGVTLPRRITENVAYVGAFLYGCLLLGKEFYPTWPANPPSYPKSYTLHHPSPPPASPFSINKHCCPERFRLC